MSLFNKIKGAKKAADEHKKTQKEEEPAKPAYKHVPTHAQQDAVNTAAPPPSDTVRAQIREQQRRRSAMPSPTGSDLSYQARAQLVRNSSGDFPSQYSRNSLPSSRSTSSLPHSMNSYGSRSNPDMAGQRSGPPRSNADFFQQSRGGALPRSTSDLSLQSRNGAMARGINGQPLPPLPYNPSSAARRRSYLAGSSSAIRHSSPLAYGQSVAEVDEEEEGAGKGSSDSSSPVESSKTSTTSDTSHTSVSSRSDGLEVRSSNTPQKTTPAVASRKSADVAAMAPPVADEKLFRPPELPTARQASPVRRPRSQPPSKTNSKLLADVPYCPRTIELAPEEAEGLETFITPKTNPQNGAVKAPMASALCGFPGGKKGGVELGGMLPSRPSSRSMDPGASTSKLAMPPNIFRGRTSRSSSPRTGTPVSGSPERPTTAKRVEHRTRPSFEASNPPLMVAPAPEIVVEPAKEITVEQARPASKPASKFTEALAKDITVERVQPASKLTEAPAKEIAMVKAQPTNKIAEAPAKEIAVERAQPARKSTEVPAKSPVRKSTELSAEAPAKLPFPNTDYFNVKPTPDRLIHSSASDAPSDSSSSPATTPGGTPRYSGNAAFFGESAKASGARITNSMMYGQYGRSQRSNRAMRANAEAEAQAHFIGVPSQSKMNGPAGQLTEARRSRSAVSWGPSTVIPEDKVVESSSSSIMLPPSPGSIESPVLSPAGSTPVLQISPPPPPEIPAQYLSIPSQHPRPTSNNSNASSVYTQASLRAPNAPFASQSPASSSSSLAVSTPDLDFPSHTPTTISHTTQQSRNEPTSTPARKISNIATPSESDTESSELISRPYSSVSESTPPVMVPAGVIAASSAGSKAASAAAVASAAKENKDSVDRVPSQTSDRSKFSWRGSRHQKSASQVTVSSIASGSVAESRSSAALERSLSMTSKPVELLQLPPISGLDFFDEMEVEGMGGNGKADEVVQEEMDMETQRMPTHSPGEMQKEVDIEEKDRGVHAQRIRPVRSNLSYPSPPAVPNAAPAPDTTTTLNAASRSNLSLSSPPAQQYLQQQQQRQPYPQQQEQQQQQWTPPNPSHFTTASIPIPPIPTSDHQNGHRPRAPSRAPSSRSMTQSLAPSFAPSEKSAMVESMSVMTTETTETGRMYGTEKEGKEGKEGRSKLRKKRGLVRGRSGEGLKGEKEEMQVGGGSGRRWWWGGRRAGVEV
ncbi:hypothetical protein K402DRAFT_417048 [Aulographum hederae CBS 113979]|uniref:Uncharacterized protein n=1 Tax=Aulographum hederae CBS 113979 TaxID=1176131 RepID=A0A6G1HD21_9PEZI|nr:hypothetical protein K402DRAFT_417048 [Aulographum hederae CBS 113979]